MLNSLQIPNLQLQCMFSLYASKVWLHNIIHSSNKNVSHVLGLHHICLRIPWLVNDKSLNILTLELSV